MLMQRRAQVGGAKSVDLIELQHDGFSSLSVEMFLTLRLRRWGRGRERECIQGGGIREKGDVR